MKKRGLSNIVATVFIVLITIAAIAIVWAFIAPMLTGAGSSIAFQQKCLETTAKATKCEYNPGAAIAKVNVQLAKGTAVQLLAIVEDESGENVFTNTYDNPTALATPRVDVIVAEENGTDLHIAKARAAAIVGDEEGNTYQCDPSATTVNCVCAATTTDETGTAGSECDDGVDNDCDGEIDEDGCTP